MTCTGSDTRYSFAHFGTSGRLFVFEAPIDMLSFLTLYPQNWQEHSYITLNGVYEHPLLGALETHDNLQQICFCTDNDEGGIDGYERLRDILKNDVYTGKYTLKKREKAYFRNRAICKKPHKWLYNRI